MEKNNVKIKDKTNFKYKFLEFFNCPNQTNSNFENKFFFIDDLKYKEENKGIKNNANKIIADGMKSKKILVEKSKEEKRSFII
jgi:hypothetical protein